MFSSDILKGKELPPYIPPSVKPNQLNDDLNLLDKETIATISKKELGHRYSKKEMKIPYGIYYGAEGPAAILNNDGKQLEIGGGGNGKIKVMQLSSNEWKALKTQKLIADRDEADFKRECKVLYELNKTKDPKGIIRSWKKFFSKGNVSLNLETGMDLHDWMMMRNTTGYSYNEITHPHLWSDLIWIEIAIKLAQAIKTEIHDKGFFSIDIKLENFMFDLARPERVAPVDFGFAEAFEVDGEGNKFVKARMLRGTESYVAPELRKQFPYYYTEKTEVYALGCLFHWMLLNNVLLEKQDKDKPILERETELGAVDLINRMKNKNPNQRPTMEKIIQELFVIRENFVKKYPKSEALAEQVYLKAWEIENRRLQAINEKKPSFLNSITELKKFITETKEENKIILEIEAMNKSGFDFSAQDNRQLLFHLIFPLMNLGFVEALGCLHKNAVNLEVEENSKTPAILAALHGKTKALQKLAELDVDINAQNSNSLTAAYYVELELHKPQRLVDEKTYDEVLDILHKACIKKTNIEHQKAQSSFLYNLIGQSYEARLRDNISKAGLDFYFLRLQNPMGIRLVGI